MSNEELLAGQRAAVLACLLHGRDFANSRRWIASHTHLSDRVVRQRIEDLRNEGHLICNLQDGSGYFLAETEEEVRAQYEIDCARAMSILRRLKPFKKYLRNAEKDEFQIAIEEFLEKE